MITLACWEAFGPAPRPIYLAVARGARRNGPHERGWVWERTDAFREGVAEPVRELSTLENAAALDEARHARGYPRPAQDCGLCRGLGILTSRQGWRLAGGPPVVVHCPTCNGRGWVRP